MLDPIQGFVISIGVICGVLGFGLACLAMVRLDKQDDLIYDLSRRASELERRADNNPLDIDIN